MRWYCGREPAFIFLEFFFGAVPLDGTSCFFTLGGMVEQVYRGRKGNAPLAMPFTPFRRVPRGLQAALPARSGFLRPIIPEVVEKFLECGDLARGFARIRCCRVAHECLIEFLRTSRARRRRPRHRHGHSHLRRVSGFPPHLHALVADGLFARSGVFHVMPDTGLKPLEELFRAE